MPTQFFEGYLATIDEVVRQFIINTWLAFHTEAADAITVIAIVALAVTGYLLMFGYLEMTVQALVPHLFRYGVIFAFATSHGLLVGVVYEAFVTIPEALAAFMMDAAAPEGSTSQSAINLMDRILSTGMRSARLIAEQAGTFSWGAHSVGLLISLCTLLLIVVALFILTLSKLAVAVLLAAAPFFIVPALFNWGRTLLEAWIKQTLTFALIPMFMYALIGLNQVILGEAAGGIEVPVTATGEVGALPTFTEIIPFVLTCLVNLLLVFQVMNWSSALAGGMALATGLQPARQTVRSTDQAVRSTGRVAGASWSGGRVATTAAVAATAAATPAVVAAAGSVLGRGQATPAAGSESTRERPGENVKSDG